MRYSLMNYYVLGDNIHSYTQTPNLIPVDVSDYIYDMLVLRLLRVC